MTFEIPEEEIKLCRICLEEEEEIGSLFSPCECKGTQKYVHKECLNQWRKQEHNNTSFTRCPTCHFTYRNRREGEGTNFGYLYYLQYLSNPFVALFVTVCIVITCLGCVTSLLSYLFSFLLPLKFTGSPFLLSGYILCIVSFILVTLVFILEEQEQGNRRSLENWISLFLQFLIDTPFNTWNVEFFGYSFTVFTLFLFIHRTYLFIKRKVQDLLIVNSLENIEPIS